MSSELFLNNFKDLLSNQINKTDLLESIISQMKQSKYSFLLFLFIR